MSKVKIQVSLPRELLGKIDNLVESDRKRSIRIEALLTAALDDDVVSGVVRALLEELTEQGTWRAGSPAEALADFDSLADDDTLRRVEERYRQFREGE